MTSTAPAPIPPPSPPAAPPFMRRPWALGLALVMVFLGALLNVGYLVNHSPVDLSEDETHYWEWSRDPHLDIGYYSKGPGIAWILRAGTSVASSLGQSHPSMAVIRAPAVLFSVLSGLLSMALARRVFRDDRAALLVTLLSAAVPMFVVGALLITIDSPMYLCWAAAVYCLYRRVEDSDAGDGWPIWLYLAGLATGLGMLCKPVLIAVPLCALIFALIEPAVRKKLLGRHGLLALVLALALQFPIVLWNARHGWVMFRHIGGQAGVGRPFSALGLITGPLGYVLGQAGNMAVIMFVLLVLAVVWALRTLKAPGSLAATPATDCPAHGHRALRFLLAFTLPLWLFYLFLSLVTKVEPNWPAASYFTGMILLAGVALQHWLAPEKRAYRRWVVVAIVWGVLIAGLVEHTELFYPMLAKHIPAGREGKKSWLHPSHWDLSLRLRGMQERADVVEQVRRAMHEQTGRWPLIATDRYDTSSSLAFYLPDQPFVYSIMSYVGSRHSQYDMWPGLNETDAGGRLIHEGQDVLLIGGLDAEGVVLEQVLRPSFEHIAAPEQIPYYYHGIRVKDVTLWKCYGFRAPLKPLDKSGY